MAQRGHDEALADWQLTGQTWPAQSQLEYEFIVKTEKPEDGMHAHMHTCTHTCAPGFLTSFENLETWQQEVHSLASQ